MKTVKIAELRNRLSYYLRRVQQGEPILVSDRDRVVARIDRVEPHAAGTDSEWLERLERRGIVRRGKGRPTPEWLTRRPLVRADVVAALLEERENGR
ncbi:MAG: type II toxin-antitoxin system Phd/YefM family antitoxin [Vicinamibacteria bacterium]